MLPCALLAACIAVLDALRSYAPTLHSCAVCLCRTTCLSPQVGKQLADVYWRFGNGAAFLDLVKQLTGKPLAADAWVSELQTPMDKEVC